MNPKPTRSPVWPRSANRSTQIALIFSPARFFTSPLSSSPQSTDPSFHTLSPLQTSNLGAAATRTAVHPTRLAAGDDQADGSETTPNTVVFPGLGTAEEDAEFSDELSEQDLKEERMEARRMQRHRERLEAMKFLEEQEKEAEEKADEKGENADEKQEKEASKDAEKDAPKEADTQAPKEAEKQAEKQAETQAETQAATHAKAAVDAKAKADAQAAKVDAEAKAGKEAEKAPEKAAKEAPKDAPKYAPTDTPASDDYHSSPYAEAPYDDAGDDAGTGSIADLLKMMNQQASDPRSEIHAPSAKLSQDNAELLRRVSTEKPVDPTGEKEMGYLRFPNVVGEVVTFVSEGNIWVGSVTGGPAARVSASYSAEALPKLSPDGKQIAFLAQSVDGYEVFTVPVAGGTTTRVSYGSAAVRLEGWTAEGKILIVTTFFSPTGLPQLSLVDPSTKNMSVLPFARATGGTQDEQGCYVFYPLRQTSSTKRYEGGEQSRLWRWCFGETEAKLLTDEVWTQRGSWSPVTTPAMPDTVFFLSDKSGVTNIWSMKLDGSMKQQISNECGMDVMEFDLDSGIDGNGNVVGVARIGGSLRRFQIARAGPMKNGEPALQGEGLQEIPITLVSEFRESSIQKLRYPLEELREVALSEDGMYAALVIRGQIFFTPLLEQLGSRIEQVTGMDGAVRYRHVQFVKSEYPEDNAKILAMSDASGEYEYVLLERLNGGAMGGLWNETQLTSGGSIKGVMSYSTVSPDSSSLVFDDTYGRISVLNLSSTAVNTYDFKTMPDVEESDDATEDDAMQQLMQMMSGGGPSGGLGGANAMKATVVPLSAARAPKDTKKAGLTTPEDDESEDPAKSVRARERSKLRRKRRAFRREARSQFRRDWRLAHALPLSTSNGPLSSSPRSFPGFEQSDSNRSPKAKDMHHGRFGGQPLDGGFSDLFGAHLGSSGPTPNGAPGTATSRTVMAGLRPEAAGEYSWSPDGKWLAFSATDETEFSTINVWRVDTGEVLKLTHPSYNAVEPKFSPDGFFLYYFSDQQIESGADSPYGMRGSEPTIVGAQQLMCLPLREGFKCPFFLGDELNPQGQIFDPAVGKKYPTKINLNNIEKRAVPVPFLEKKQYADLHIINGGSTFVMQMWDGVGFYLIAMDIMSGSVVPIYPDPLGVYVSGDGSVLMIAVEQGLALFSAKALAMPDIDQDALLGSAAVWTPPESWAVTVNPRAEWMQMFNDAMRNMRDAFYDPGMHGIDWPAVTEMYRPLVYKISTKSELRDVLQQALGELSVLHVFVSIRADAPTLPVGEPSACLGGSLVVKPNGLEVVRVYDTSGVLAAPDSPLSAMAVDLRPGDVITRVDGLELNASDASLSRVLLGKAGMQVLLEIDQKPREAKDDDEEEIMAQLQGGGGFMDAPGGAGGAYATSAAAMGAMTSGGSNNRGFGQLPSVRQHANDKRRRKFAAKLGAAAEGAGAGDGKGNGAGNGDTSNQPHADPASDPNSYAFQVTHAVPPTPVKMISGIKNVVVTPLSRDECSVLKSADALNNRRGYVQQKSNDKLAYVYLEDMEQMGEGSSNSFDDFAAQFYPAIRKAGLIIDVRRNAGGNIDTWILERLRRVAWMFNTQRAGPGDTTMQYAFRGKVTVLVDEMTSSDAEIFAAGVQQLGLGKVVGARTWGGAVGYSSNPELALVDGSGFTIPSFGPYVGGKWMIEQRGVVPDIEVANDPVATFNGRDAQLDAAVEHLMGLIAQEPDSEKVPEKPEYPDWSFDRETCAAGGDGGKDARAQRLGVLATGTERE